MWFLIASLLWTWSPLQCWHDEPDCSALWIDLAASASYLLCALTCMLDWCVANSIGRNEATVLGEMRREY